MKINTRFKSWKAGNHPRKVLAIRFQALGDTVVTLAYLQALKRKYPAIELHFLTHRAVSSIPTSLEIFDKIIVIGGGRNAKFQFVLAMFKMPYLWWQGYDVVLDIQNHRFSVIIRKLLNPRAWAEFDKYSPLPGGERMKDTIEAIGLWKVNLDTHFKFRKPPTLEALKNHWKEDHLLVVLNPAAWSPSRNWPIQNYIDFANLWLQNVDEKTQFLLLLLPMLREKANIIKTALGDHCIDLTGYAGQMDAFAMIQRCNLMLSEDSGLMHMAWIQKIPTIGLFSASRKDWSAPQGEWSYCFDSSDLPCGPCMLEVCKFNDNRCLTRYTPAIVLQKARELCGK